jgi:hypothetical protein
MCGAVSDERMGLQFTVAAWHWQSSYSEVCLLHILDYANSWNVAASNSYEVIEFLIYLILLATLGPGIFWSSNMNEYQKQREMFLGSRTWPVCRADNLTASRKPIV